MVYSISNVATWQAICKKYRINELDTPSNWPVLLSFEPPIFDDPDEGATNVSVIHVEQAAKFLSICSPNRLVAIDASTRMKLNIALGGVPVGTKEKINPVLTPKVYTAQDQMGNLTTISGFPPTVSFKVGDSVQFNNNLYTITAVASAINTTNPITGEQGMIEVKDDEAPDSNIPGLTEIPLDPGKFAKKDQIADISDTEEHVLDDERDV
jgi:hypothetical protein